VVKLIRRVKVKRFKKVSDVIGPCSLSDRLLPFLFSLPALFLYIIFVLWPLLNTFYTSFFKWDGFSPKQFVGLNNFARAFVDSIVITSLWHNVIWVILQMIIPVSIALLLVVILSRKISNAARLVLRTVYFIPTLLSTVAVAIIWEWMLNPYFGVINKLLQSLGLSAFAQPWLGQPSTALLSVFAASAWSYYGFCLIILLAAVQKIDPSLYDAATVDGASGWQSFWNITIPSIRNELSFLLIYSAIQAFKIFDLVYIMTGGGPYYSTEVIATLVYRKAFWENETGYASCIAVLMTLIVAIPSIALSLKNRED